MTTLFCFISLDTLLATFLWLYWVFMCVCFLASLCVSARLSASCHIVTCFFVVVVVVHFSIVTTLFCFISLDTLSATFLWLYWVSMWVFSCISLHLHEAFCVMSCCKLFFCWCCSFLTCDNSLLFYFIRYIIRQLFCVCIECLCVCFLASLCILAKLFASCHIATCFFVVVVHFSLMTTLFCFILLGRLLAIFCCCIECLWVHLLLCNFWFLRGFLHPVTLQLVSLLMLLISHLWQLSLFYFIRYIIGDFFVVVLSVYVCVFLHHSASWWGFLHRVTLRLVSLLLLLLFFLTHGTHQTCGMSSDWSKRCWQIYCN